jgi:3-deoxy-D-manno-octulosonate 8-phosphate phosphatase (KDO 8-P phosphatase)
MSLNYKVKLNHIKAFVFDIDGVMTNGSFQVGSDGKPVRNLNSKDGYALQLAIKKGYIVGVISGGQCEGVKSLFKKAGLTDIYMGAKYKLDAWNDFLAVYEHKELLPEHILYMGDDIPDYPLIERAGVGCTPANGSAEVKQIADYVSHRNGGEGCVRDVIEQTLKVQQNWMLKEDFAW